MHLGRVGLVVGIAVASMSACNARIPSGQLALAQADTGPSDGQSEEGKPERVVPGPGTVLYDRYPAKVYSLESDESNLYWNEADGQGLRIVKAPKSGAGPAVTMGEWFGDDVTSQLIAVDATYLYWMYFTHINKVPKAGGTVIALELGPLHYRASLVERDDMLYVADHGCLALGHIPKLGGAAVYVAVIGHSDAGRTTAVAVDDSYVYCGNGSDIFRVPRAGGDVAKIVGDQEVLGPLALTGDYLYWINNRHILGTSGNLAALSVDGGLVSNLGNAAGQVGRLRYDPGRDRLYWTTGGGLVSERVMVYLISQQQIVTLASGQRILGSMAMDDGYVYWVRENEIMRLPKD